MNLHHSLQYYISCKSLLRKADHESCFQEWKSCGVRTLEHYPIRRSQPSASYRRFFEPQKIRVAKAIHDKMLHIIQNQSAILYQLKVLYICNLHLYLGKSSILQNCTHVHRYLQTANSTPDWADVGSHTNASVQIEMP